MAKTCLETKFYIQSTNKVITIEDIPPTSNRCNSTYIPVTYAGNYQKDSNNNYILAQHDETITQSLGQGDDDLDVVLGEVTRFAVECTLKPVIVNLVNEGDHVALVEAQLALVLGLKVIDGACTWLRGGPRGG